MSCRVARGWWVWVHHAVAFLVRDREKRAAETETETESESDPAAALFSAENPSKLKKGELASYVRILISGNTTENASRLKKRSRDSSIKRGKNREAR
jgi:hypothetical protein